MTPLFNLFKLSHFVPLSLVHNVVFPLSCESGGYLNRSVCTRVSLCLYKRGGINFYSPFYPLLCGSLGPKHWWEWLLYFTFIRLSALFFSVMFIHLSMVSCERNGALNVCTCSTLSVQGERMEVLVWVLGLLCTFFKFAPDQLRNLLHYHLFSLHPSSYNKEYIIKRSGLGV